MLSFLKQHPFAVEARFEQSIVLTYAVDQQELKSFIPACLELDVYEDKWAFVAMAIVKTKGLRPKGFPVFMGSDFGLIGYRVFVKYTDSKGKRLRGLYILKSETDRARMKFFGNIFTHYNYGTTDILFVRNNANLTIASKKSNLHIELHLKLPEEVSLPSDSPFKNWKTARRFAGPLPFTFTYDEILKEVLIIEGVRENWTPAPVEIVKNESGFMTTMHLKNVLLANAFMIENVPYYWKKGRIDHWKG